MCGQAEGSVVVLGEAVGCWKGLAVNGLGPGQWQLPHYVTGEDLQGALGLGWVGGGPGENRKSWNLRKWLAEKATVAKGESY
jgi:hypothetical protein